MNKSRIAALLISLSLLAFSRAAAADGPWYVSMELGKASFSGLQDTGGPLEPLPDLSPSPLTSSTIDKHDTTYRVAAGYRFDRYFSLELAYINLGKVEQADSYAFYNAHPPGTTINGFQDNDDRSVWSRGFALEPVFTLPLNDSWSVFGRAGVFFAHTVLEQNILVNRYGLVNLGSFPILYSYEYSHNSTTATYGLGIDWALSSRWSLSLAWDHYGSLGSYSDPTTNNSDTGRYSESVTALGVTFSF